MAFNLRQYEVPEPFFGAADANVVHPEDKKRIQAYDLYEDIYNNNHKSLKIVMRGADSLPIYMPSGRKIVNATNRFLAKGLDYYVEPNTLDGAPADAGTVATLELWFKNFYKRETVPKKLNSNKRWGLVRADAVLLLQGDPNKAEGERISLHEVDPRFVFAIDDPEDPNKVMGYHMAERVIDFREKDKSTTKQICRRTTWLRERDTEGAYTGKITHEVTHWTIGKWDDRVLEKADMEQIPYPAQDEPIDYLPPEITKLPIYIWNTDAPQNSTWGTSLLSGMETLVFGINQSLSDEDLTLVMQGLGMYSTNAAPPIDPDTGAILSWGVGPGQVIEVGPDQEFVRVTGVSDVSPYQDHMNFMDDKGLQEAGGVPAVAVGRVDVAIAESGVSLKLQFDPLLAANAEREVEIIVTLDQLHHDITSMWIPAYEKIDTKGVVVSTIVDDPMPVDKAAVVQDVVLLRTSNLILTSMAVDKLSELGWKYPPELSVDEVVAALEAQTKSDSAALNAGFGDPNALAGGSAEDPNNPGFDMNGNPIDAQGNPIPDQTSVDLGVTP
jgi:hypothetical protein